MSAPRGGIDVREDVVLDALQASNTPGPEAIPYPESMRPIARAVLAALDGHARQQREQSVPPKHPDTVRVEAVRAMHRPIPGNHGFDECDWCQDPDYPCATIRALDEATS